MKPRVFIGSSTENLGYARAVEDQLKSKADVRPWDKGFFSLNSSFLESLLNGLKETDFGVFIFSPSDLATIREDTCEAVRDNVLFEFGIFLGGLGRQRSFFIVPQNQSKLRLPSDLLGIKTVKFDMNQEPIADALKPACDEILKAIDEHGVRQERFGTPSVEIVSNPKILCTCSPQFFSSSFQNDVKVIRDEMQIISDNITVLHNVKARQLRGLMQENTFDIIHVATMVDQKTGDLYFSDIENRDGVPRGSDNDTIRASSFATLVELCKARLVTLATCDSLILAAKLAKVTNMIAATDTVSIDDMLDWELSFYKCISKGISLSNSFEKAASLNSAPMLLLTKKDLAFIR